MSNSQQTLKEKFRDALPFIAASVISGIMTRACLHPVDTMKSQMQAFSNKMTFKELLAQQNIRNLYSGFGATCLVSIPGVTTYFGVYEASKKYLHQTFNVPLTENSHAINFVSGIVAEAVSCVFWVPGDIIKERMQIQQLKNTSLTTHYRSPLHVLQDVYQKQGLWKGIYKGYGATLLSFGPYSALYLTFYEIFKKKAAEAFNVDQATLGMCFVAGGTSGALAAVITSPLDLIKIRLQVQRAAQRAAMDASPTEQPKYVLGYNYKNVLDGLRHVWKDGGVRGLLRGCGARVAFTAPAAAITISLFDTIRLHIDNAMNPSHREHRVIDVKD